MFEVVEPEPKRAAEPVAEIDALVVRLAFPGMNVVAVPLKEKFDVREPLAGSNA